MKWELTKRTAILGRALACGFFLTVLAGFFPFAAASEELSGQAELLKEQAAKFRLHTEEL